MKTTFPSSCYLLLLLLLIHSINSQQLYEQNHNILLQLNVSGDFPENSGTINRSNQRILSSLFTILNLSCIILFTFSLFVIIIYKKRSNRIDRQWKLTAFRSLNFSEMDLLSELTKENVIGKSGSGKVYKIVMNSSETVAVRKIWSDRKKEKQVMDEVNNLGLIRHKNIAKLLGCGSYETTSKFLVYENMQNHQTLEELLHNNKNRRIPGSDCVNIDWPKRYQIAVGAARGLCYMHHECSPPVIHSDLKSSNILLDSEFNPKIADLGLAKLLPKKRAFEMVSDLAGSYGYMAPEYGYTARVNDKIDVFSFGVILLELVTGREAMDGKTTLVEWGWNHIQEGKPITDALDEKIKKDCYLDEMSSVFKLGLICTATLPSTRPTMNQALQILIAAGARWPMIMIIKRAGGGVELHCSIIRNVEET